MSADSSSAAAYIASLADAAQQDPVHASTWYCIVVRNPSLFLYIRTFFSVFLPLVFSFPRLQAKLPSHQACAFAACNQGRLVADVYKVAIEAHAGDTEAQRSVLRRIKGQ